MRKYIPAIITAGLLAVIAAAFLVTAALKNKDRINMNLYPGKIQDPVLYVKGEGYSWLNAVSEKIPDERKIPDGYSLIGEIKGNFTEGEPEDFMLYADFEVSGSVYYKDGGEKYIYARITTEWLDNALIRFEKSADRIEE